MKNLIRTVLLTAVSSGILVANAAIAQGGRAQEGTRTGSQKPVPAKPAPKPAKPAAKPAKPAAQDAKDKFQRNQRVQDKTKQAEAKAQEERKALAEKKRQATKAAGANQDAAKEKANRAAAEADKKKQEAKNGTPKRAIGGKEKEAQELRQRQIEADKKKAANTKGVGGAAGTREAEGEQHGVKNKRRVANMLARDIQNHRTRMARMDRLAQVFRDKGEGEKVTRTMSLKKKQDGLFKKKLARYKNALGDHTYNKVLSDLRAQGQK